MDLWAGKELHVMTAAGAFASEKISDTQDSVLKDFTPKLKIPQCGFVYQYLYS